MKKVLILFALILGISAVTTTASASYKINDSAIESLFNKAEVGTMSVMFNGLDDAASASKTTVKEKSATAALIIDFFLGGLGIHRFYLGTKVMTGLGYILTCGGIFGLVPLVDLIVIAVNFDDISQYVDNPKFFMW
ncbi:TM2 domain-containing protein [Saccharicrinis fermentans]|uniref:TM2 domain protein n=1 Tax=Saccharicrinis fermentans DSM 9555 = JCM 21142 TaxID=869213 RepID=W7YBS9_9BACT|nr:TM2 domain-containing protein [Saccharicrinis fermentans]GAF05897.1 TM2 domain protein [Saccharicrinis fermentans DSM 9555 = JCM 21142]